MWDVLDYTGHFIDLHPEMRERVNEILERTRLTMKKWGISTQAEIAAEHEARHSKISDPEWRPISSPNVTTCGHWTLSQVAKNIPLGQSKWILTAQKGLACPIELQCSERMADIILRSVGMESVV